jgi:serine/threonine-protein kinase
VDPAHILPPALRGRYVLQKVLGRGSVGQVLLARDSELGRPVAIKLFQPRQASPSLLERFEQEARVTSRVDHPHVVRLYDHGLPADGPAFILYEFVEGVDLAQALIRNGGPFPPVDVLAWGEALSDALAVAHAQGVIHRDVKPANVILRDDGTPVLCDFGLARLTTGGGRATTRGKVVGTLAYMDPHSLVRGTPADAASDQWSLAATLYTMLTGKGPVTDENFADVLATAGEALEVALPREVEKAVPGLTSLMRRALSPDPTQRFPDMVALRNALGFLRQGATASGSGSVGVSPHRSQATRPLGESVPPKRPSVELPRPSRYTGVRPVGPRAAGSPRPRRRWSWAAPAAIGFLGLAVAGTLLHGPWQVPGVSADPGPARGAAPATQARPLEDQDLAEATRRLADAEELLSRWHMGPGCLASPFDFVAGNAQFEHVRGQLEKFADAQMSFDLEDFAVAALRWVRAMERWESDGTGRRAAEDPEIARRLEALGSGVGFRLMKDLRDVDTALLLNFTGVVPDHALLRYRADTRDTHEELKVPFFPLVDALLEWGKGDRRALRVAGTWANLINSKRIPDVQRAILEEPAMAGLPDQELRELVATAMFPIGSAFLEGQSGCEPSLGSLARAEALLDEAGCSSLYVDCPDAASIFNVAILRAAIRCDGVPAPLERALLRVERSLAEAGAAPPPSLWRVWTTADRLLLALSTPPPRARAHLDRIADRLGVNTELR